MLRRPPASVLAVVLAAVLALPLGTALPAQAAPPPTPLASSMDGPGEPGDEPPGEAGAPGGEDDAPGVPAEGEQPGGEGEDGAGDSEGEGADGPAEGPLEDEPSEEAPTTGAAEAPAPLDAPVFGVLGSESGTRPLALTAGHIDLFEVTYDVGLGGLRLSVKDDTGLYQSGAQYRDPTTVAVHVDTALAAVDISGAPSPAFDFLKQDGGTVYLLPEVQNHALPWPGWSTERLNATLPAELALPASGAPVSLDVRVEGPGNVYTWMTGFGGSVINRFVDTRDPAPDVIPISRNAHVHTNWAFTAPGVYVITVTPSATTEAGGTITGPGVVYQIVVGPAEDAAPTATTAPVIVGTGAVGDPLTVAEGEWLPSPHGFSYRWLREGAAIEGATGASYTPVAGDLGRRITAEVTARVGAGTGAATTAPVEVVVGEAPVTLSPTSFQTFTATPASPRIGQNITLTAVVNPRGGTTAAPLGVGGIVEFSRGSGADAVVIGQVAITSLTLSRATLVVPASELGAATFSARYLPPSTHAVAASAPATVTVVPAATNVTAAASLAEAAVGQPVTVAAAVVPAAATGTVRILDGDTVIAEGPVEGGRFQATVSDLLAGDYSLRASFTSAVPEFGDSASLPTLLVPLTVVEGAPRGTWSRTVVDHEHVDVFSVTLDGTTLRLGTRIDLDGSSKTSLPKFGNNRERIEPESAVFLLPDKVSTGLGQPGGRKTVPSNPNYAFLGEPGDTVWVAPASSDLTPFLYAGFESESIGSGALQGNRIDIHLVGVEAPAGGRFEAYTGALTPTGNPWRLLSSTDPAYSSAPFATGTHDHFNWVFTAPGTYVLSVKATATLADGTPVESEVRTFTWVVGDLAAAPTVTVGPDAGTAGEAALTATVDPAAEGDVEFRDADGALLGFAAVAEGAATLPVALAAGAHEVTADFVPAALDRDLPASSGPVAVQVAPAATEPVDLRQFTLTRGHIDLFELTYSAEADGLLLRVKDDTNLYQTGAAYRAPESVTVFVDTGLTAWSTPTSAWAAPLYSFIGPPGTPVYRLPANYTPSLPWPGWSTERLASTLPAGVQAAPGFPVEFAVEASGPGDLFIWALDVDGEPVNRFIDTRDPGPDVIPAFIPSHVHTTWAFTQPGDYVLTVTPRLALADGGVMTGAPVVYHFRVGPADGLALAGVEAPQLTGSGEVGSPLAVSPGQWLPSPHEIAVQWLRDGEPISGATGAGYVPTAADEGRAISARVTATVGPASATAESAPVTVVEAGDPGGPATVTLGEPASSYRQGEAILLEAVVTPALAEGDTLAWQWRWPGAGAWAAIPGASGTAHELTAEQALNGVEVRVRLTPAGIIGEPVDSETRLIRVDDEGAVPAQQLSIAGAVSVAEGDTVQLAAAVAPPSVLTAYLWERAPAGSDDFAPIAGTTGAALSFAATLGLDGSRYRVSLAAPDGMVAYGPSPAVTLAVAEGPGPGETPWDVPNGTSTYSGQRIINLGHVDIASIIEGGTLVTRFKDDTAGDSVPVFRELGDVVLQALPGAKREIPADRDDFAFIADPGQEFWLLPAVQDYDLLWPGWSTELIAPGVLAGPVEWTLTEVSGPGELALWETVGFGDHRVLWSTRDGITAADSFGIPPSAHVHGNWGFTAEGVYCLAFDRTATLSGGGAQTVSSVLAVAVGELDIRRVNPADCFTSAPGEPGWADDEPVGEEQLTEEAAGGVQVLEGQNGFTPGQLVTVQVGEEHAGRWVSAWLHSDPAWLGWALVGQSGAVQVRLPADAALGGHRIVVKDRDGALIGWDALTVVAPAGSGTPPTPTTPTDPTYPDQQCVAGSVILSSGHIDYATRVVGGKLESYIGDDTGGSKVYREPSGVVMWLKPSSAVTLPSGMSQVGPAGSTVWQVPQTQNANLIWLGWNTELINSGNASSPVTWRLDNVSGPGTVRVYTQGSFGGVTMVLNGAGSSHTIPQGVHVHANWAFSAEGVYRLTFTQTATLVGGQSSSDTETVTIVVGDVDPASAAGGSGCGAVSAAILGSEDQDAAKLAAAQAAAAAAAAAKGALPGQAPGGVAIELVDPIAALVEGNPVPLLLAVLGGLLLVGAAGLGALWWRRRRAAA